MNEKKKKITTPITNTEIEIKEWITGQDSEYINDALMAGVEMKPDITNKTAIFNKFKPEAINEQTHREVERFVVSVAGVKEKVLEAILALPEEDYNFVRTCIAEIRGKKKLNAEVGA